MKRSIFFVSVMIVICIGVSIFLLNPKPIQAEEDVNLKALKGKLEQVLSNQQMILDRLESLSTQVQAIKTWRKK